MPAPAAFYFDVASPFAYLASARVDALLGTDAVWRPILVGALHRRHRRASWGATPEMRARGVAEIERRAAAYGLPAFAWPDPYPANTLVAMRGATWADGQGRARAFAEAAWAMAFVEGVDLTVRGAVLEAADRAGLDAAALDVALDDPELKAALRRANDEAIETGVHGVPTFDAGGLLWWGDELLPAAAVAHGRG